MKFCEEKRAWGIRYGKRSFALLGSGIFMCMLFWAVGCTSKSEARGVVIQEPFFLQDPNPVLRLDTHSQGILVSMSEETETELRMVLIRLPETKNLPLDEPIPVSTGLGDRENEPSLEVSEGAKEISFGSNGQRILSMGVVRFARSESGQVVLRESGDRMTGEFQVEL